MDVAIGFVLVVLGAYGAAQSTTRLPAAGQGRMVVPALAVAGAIIGAGGAMVRGWDLLGSTVAGAVVVPLLAIAVRIVETRRRGGAA